MTNDPISIKFKKLFWKYFHKNNFIAHTKANVAYCYHSISNDDWEFSTNPEVFEMQIKQIINHKKIVDLETFVNKTSITKTNLATITFDDGYEDVYTTAFPILKKYNITATVFITGIREFSTGSELNASKKLLSLEQIQLLRKNGWVIGFHTWSHRPMHSLSRKDIIFEITTGKLVLEKTLGFNLDYFAYPSGFYNKYIQKNVKLSGFKAAFTVDGGSSNLRRNNYLINRVQIDRSINKLDDFMMYISDRGITFNHVTTKLIHTANSLKTIIKNN